MNIPGWLIGLLEDHFTPHQVAVIATHWWTHTSISLSNSSREELLATAKTILNLRA